MTLTRRRVIAMSALALLTAGRGRAALPAQVWQGRAMGAAVTLRTEGASPAQARAFFADAERALRQTEATFSLHADSALARLNRDGYLAYPGQAMLTVLHLAGAIHAATGGAFDPTVQPVWQARAHGLPEPAHLSGWSEIEISERAIRLPRPGMALTLNGVAQGLIADRVAARLRAEGATDVMVDAGEIAAFGRAPADMSGPGASGWPITLAAGPRLTLQEGGLATSAPLGTVFDAPGRQGHILDPRTGAPAAPVWDQVSISAPSAALADALSTAACLMRDAAALSRMIAGFAGARIEAAIPRA